MVRFGGITALVLCAAALAPAQRAFEEDGHAFYESRLHKRVDLGPGVSPVLTRDGKVALLRGRLFRYAEEVNCERPEARNWVAVVDPETRVEKKLFDRSVTIGKQEVCAFARMALSPEGATLYLVNTINGDAAGLAVLPLGRGQPAFAPGVDDVYVIQGGTRNGELIYTQHRKCAAAEGQQRACHPVIHASPEGALIRLIAEEKLDPSAEKTAAYLRQLGGRILLNGQPFPE